MNELSVFSRKEGIFCKLDWYSVIFKDTTFSHCLLFLGLDPDLCVADFLSNRVDIGRGAFDILSRFSFNGVCVEANYYDVLNAVDNVFDTTFKSVKIDISGSGLDYLRECGLDPDNRLRDLSIYPENFSLTRCDFAFDLVNYKPEFLDELIAYLQENTTPAGKACMLHVRGGVNVSLRLFDQKTVYLGSTRGLRLLRCYDKKLQHIDRATGCYVVDNPYDNPESWIRLELQTRRDESVKLLFSRSDNFFLSIFRYIHDTYQFANVADSDSRSRQLAPFWEQLWDWGRIESIIQNENCIQFKTYSERVIDDFGRNVGRFLRWLAVSYKTGGREAVQAIINRYLSSLFDFYDPNSKRPRDNFINILNVMLVDDSISISDSFENCHLGFYRDCGTIGFKF